MAVATQDYGGLKPQTQALQHIIMCFGADPAHTLVIGDRDDRDGKMAQAVGCHYYHASQNKDFKKLAKLFFGGNINEGKR